LSSATCLSPAAQPAPSSAATTSRPSTRGSPCSRNQGTGCRKLIDNPQETRKIRKQGRGASSPPSAASATQRSAGTSGPALSRRRPRNPRSRDLGAKWLEVPRERQRGSRRATSSLLEALLFRIVGRDQKLRLMRQRRRN
jgi:hypothetical protein